MLEKLINELLKRQTALAMSAMEIPASDFAMYQKNVGRFAGLQEALDIIKQLQDDADQ